MRQVTVVGAGMTRFGKHVYRSMKDLAREAVEGALRSAGVEEDAIEAAAVGNAVAGLITGQECVRGQVVLREMGIGGIPVIGPLPAGEGTFFSLSCVSGRGSG